MELEKAMGNGDRRLSRKMKQKNQQRRKKERLKRQGQVIRTARKKRS